MTECPKCHTPDAELKYYWHGRNFYKCTNPECKNCWGQDQIREVKA